DYSRLRPGARLPDLSRHEFPRCVAECECGQSAPEPSDSDAPRLGREVDRVISHCPARTRDPNGIRTRVTAVKGRCPRPLDDRVRKSGGNIRSWSWQRKLFAGPRFLLVEADAVRLANGCQFNPGENPYEKPKSPPRIQKRNRNWSRLPHFRRAVRITRLGTRRPHDHGANRVRPTQSESESAGQDAAGHPD